MGNKTGAVLGVAFPLPAPCLSLSAPAGSGELLQLLLHLPGAIPSIPNSPHPSFPAFPQAMGCGTIPTARSAHFLLVRSSWIMDFMDFWGILLCFPNQALTKGLLSAVGFVIRARKMEGFVSKRWVFGIPHQGKKEGRICLQISEFGISNWPELLCFLSFFFFFFPKKRGVLLRIFGCSRTA